MISFSPLDKAFAINDYTNFYVSETDKKMKGSNLIDIDTELNAQAVLGFAGWKIGAGDSLDGLSDVYCDLPEGVAAMLWIRSTLARNRIVLTSGLYDSGFRGHVGFLLHNLSRTAAFIGEGTRVGQLILVQSDSAGLYEGGYNHEQGTDLDYQKNG